jgi:hypothetical protein
MRACLLAVAWAMPASAADVTFDPDPAFVCDTLTVDVHIDASVTDLRGFTFVFDFDPTVVTPIAVVAGPLETAAACPNFFTWINAATIGDSIWVDAATLGCSVAGPGSIVRITFATVTHAASSALACRSGSMRDALNQPIPYVCHPGVVETCPGIGVDSAYWQTVKRLYR